MEDAIRELIGTALKEVAPRKAAALEKLDFSASLRELGIDSLTAMELVGAIERRIGVTFADEELARVDKLSELARIIATKQGAAE